MSVKKYKVELSSAQRFELKGLSKRGKVKARKLTRARILLLADSNRPKGPMTDAQIVEVLDTSLSTVVRVRERFNQGGLLAALEEKSRSGRPPKFSGRQRAKVTALACTTPEQGHGHWSLRLLADKLVENEYVEAISHTSVRNILKKTNSSPI